MSRRTVSTDQTSGSPCPSRSDRSPRSAWLVAVSISVAVSASCRSTPSIADLRAASVSSQRKLGGPLGRLLPIVAGKPLRRGLAPHLHRRFYPVRAICGERARPDLAALPRPRAGDTKRLKLLCEEEDLNLHSFRNQNLNLARLPVSPSSLMNSPGHNNLGFILPSAAKRRQAESLRPSV